MSMKDGEKGDMKEPELTSLEKELEDTKLVKQEEQEKQGKGTRSK
jgi:hypothetical protein